MTRQIKLLVVDDEVRFLKTLAQRLTLRDFDVTAVSNGEAAIEAAREKDFELAILDLKMPGMGGEEVLEVLREDHPFLEVIILTGHGSVESAVEMMKGGARHYLQKPCETEKLLEVLRDAYETRMKRKLAHDERKMERLTALATGESPLGILRRMRELELEDED